MMPLSTKVLLKTREKCTEYLKRHNYPEYKKLYDETAKELNYVRKYIKLADRVDNITLAPHYNDPPLDITPDYDKY
jgi:hypothetical protein